MSKSFSNKLRRMVVMMVSVFIFANITFPASSAFASKPSWWQRTKAAWTKGKEKAKELKEKGKELKEKAKEDYKKVKEKGKAIKMAAIQAKNELKTFNKHRIEFWDSKGPMDFVGRSVWHFAYIVVVWSGILLLLYRKEDYDQSIVGFVIRFVVALVLAVFFGFYFELLRTSNIIELMHAVDAAPNLPVVTQVANTWNWFWQGLYYALPAGAVIVWVAGMVSFSRMWWHKLGDFREAWNMGERKSFLWNRVLPESLLPTDTPTTPVPQPTDTPTTPVPQPTDTPTTPVPEPIVPVAPAVQKPICSKCGAEAEAGDNCCDGCGTKFKPAMELTTRKKVVPPSLSELMWRTP